MSFIKPKTIVVGTTIGMLLLGTGCLQNVPGSYFSVSNNYNAKQVKSESDGIVALKEVLIAQLKKFLLYQL